MDYTIFFAEALKKQKNRLPSSEIDGQNWAYVQQLFWDGKQLQ